MTTSITTDSHHEAAARDLDRYLRVLAGPDPGARLLEVRFRLRGGGMGREFVPASGVPLAAAIIRRLAPVTDVYVGVALRSRRAGGREAIDRCRLAFVEIDAPDGRARLERFVHSPTMLIASGTVGHLHAYWALQAAAGVLEIECANRRLAHCLSGDPACVDAARILRPPFTLNHKRQPPTPVQLVALHPERRCALEELVGELEDPPGEPRLGAARAPRSAEHPLDRMLLAIAAGEYVQRLVGLEANRAGKVACPFHDDRDPSLQLYEDGSWYCFACRIGGTIYDFAARLWGGQTKGRGFLELRARLAHELKCQPRRVDAADRHRTLPTQQKCFVMTIPPLDPSTGNLPTGITRGDVGGAR
jgi:hypothetical protein